MDRAQPYPAHWTVKRALEAYLEENGFTAEAYDEPYTKATIGKLEIPFPNTARHRRAIMRHDLHHVITGYGTDFPGEFEVSCWEARRGLEGLGLYVAAIVTSGVVGGVLFTPRRALRAWRASGGGGPSLFAHDDYDALLDLTVGELRQRLGVPREGLAETARGLHAAAPTHADTGPFRHSVGGGRSRS